MDIVLPKKLKILSYYLPSLYIVGGYVRNALLGLPANDIDIAAEYKTDEVIAALTNTEFKTININKKLGTLKIISREDKNFAVEYTTFRIDSYPIGSGVHTPTDVVFTKDMARDAMRRDFTINAIYYSIDTAEYVDYTGGIKDLNKRIVRTTCDPEKVFAEDGLRIMRLARFAAELNFLVDANTMAAAKKQSFLLKDISGERKRDELLKILTADTKYPALRNVDAHLRGFRLLDETGSLQYILPELLKGKGIAQCADYHIYDVFEHSVQTMRYCPPKLRLAGLLHDIGKPLSLLKNGSMYMHGEIGKKIALKMLGNNGLKMSSKEIALICKLIETHMYDIDGLTSEKKLKMFIIDNLPYVKDIIDIKRADAKASCGNPNAESISANKIEKLTDVILNDGTPLSVADLKINGFDLENTKIPADKRAWAMRKILEHAVVHENCRSREQQLEYLRGLNYGGN